MNKTDNIQVKRMRVYYGYYKGWRNHYPVIRLGGKYLTRLNFEIGDTIEVIFEKGLITIAKVPRGQEQLTKPDT